MENSGASPPEGAPAWVCWQNIHPWLYSQFWFWFLQFNNKPDEVSGLLVGDDESLLEKNTQNLCMVGVGEEGCEECDGDPCKG